MKNCTFPVRSGRGKCYLCKDIFPNNPQRFYFIMKRIILLLVSLLPVLSAFSQKEKDLTLLKEQIQAIIHSCKAQVGVAFIWNGQDTLSINNDRPYPLMSVFKFHQALAVTHWLETRHLSLDTVLYITPEDLKPDTYSPLRDRYPQGNCSLSVRELLKYTLQQSDNNACDILFRLTGGPQETDRYIRSLGCSHFSITATEDDMHVDLNRSYDNWTTPLEAARLLEIFLTRELFQPSDRQFIRQTLTECETGKDRLVKPIPSGKAVIGHKTGTGDCNAQGQIIGINDIGFFLLPDGSRYSLAVFVKNSEEDAPATAGVIAAISEAVWNFVQ